MGKLRLKELRGFEGLQIVFEFLQLTTVLLQFFIPSVHVVPQAVDLVKHDFHRGFLLPRFPYGLTCWCGLRRCRFRCFLCCHAFLLVDREDWFVLRPIRRASESLLVSLEALRGCKWNERLVRWSAP